MTNWETFACWTKVQTKKEITAKIKFSVVPLGVDEYNLNCGAFIAPQKSILIFKFKKKDFFNRK